MPSEGERQRSLPLSLEVPFSSVIDSKGSTMSIHSQTPGPIPKLPTHSGARPISPSAQATTPVLIATSLEKSLPLSTLTSSTSTYHQHGTTRATQQGNYSSPSPCSSVAGSPLIPIMNSIPALNNQNAHGNSRLMAAPVPIRNRVHHVPNYQQTSGHPFGGCISPTSVSHSNSNHFNQTSHPQDQYMPAYYSSGPIAASMGTSTSYPVVLSLRDFDLFNTLGTGTFGRVYLCRLRVQHGAFFA